MPREYYKNKTNSGWFKKGFKHTEETKKRMSLQRKGKKKPESFRKFMSEFWKKNNPSKKGQRQTEEHKIKRGIAIRGEKNGMWKGGITSLIRQIRFSYKMRQWRSDIFERDDYTCQNCGKRGGNLEAHHIQRLIDIVNKNKIKTYEEALFCEEIWNINNGQTLCYICHNKTKGRK